MEINIKQEKLFTLSIIFSLVIHLLFFIRLRTDARHSFTVGSGLPMQINVELLGRSKTSTYQSSHAIADARNTGIVCASAPTTNDGSNTSTSISHYEYGGGSYIDSYFAFMREKIIRAKHYPKHAQWLSISGESKVRFILKCDGSIECIDIIKGSGYSILDEESIKAVKRASPFLPIPSSLNTDQMEIALTLKYEL